MKNFRFITDRLFVVCCGAYLLNRLVMSRCTSCAFLHSYFDDLLLIPCALPVVLAIHRRLGLRRSNEPPTGTEVLLHFALWSIVCEWLGPRLFVRAVGDPFDILAYGIGAAFAWLWWNRSRFARSAVA